MQDIQSLALPQQSQPLLEKLALCQRLPSPPGVAEKILALLEDRDATMGDFAEIIRLDPGLSARLLRLANSPIYGLRHEVLEVQQAITLLGMEATVSNALSIALMTTMRDRSASRLDHELFWRRSVGAASACRLLARHLQLPVVESFFMGALLQDIGMLALDSLDDEIYSGLGKSQADHRYVAAHEDGVFGIDHAAAGAWLASRWKLPMKYCQAILASHDPFEVPVDPEHASMADCVAVSGLIADILFGHDVQICVRRALNMGRRLTKLSADVLEIMLPRLVEELAEMSKLFELDLGDSAELAARCERAVQVMAADSSDARPQHAR
jgi:HD-like signal output (HDOD) protein